MQLLPASWTSDLLPVSPPLPPDESLPEGESGPEGGRLPWWLALVCGLAAALLLPQSNPFPYEFAEGKPWGYRDLHAPFDFEVMRSTEDVEAAAAQTAPAGAYFLLNPEVALQQKRALAQSVAEQVRISRQDVQYEDLVAHANVYVTYGQHLLDVLYERGVLDPAVRPGDWAGQTVTLKGGALERQVLADSLFTLQSARDFLTDSLSFSALRQPELLLPLLEKVLIANTFYSDSLSAAGQRAQLRQLNGTGVAIRKGDLLVRRGEALTAATTQRLHSLAARYPLPDWRRVLGGYALLGVLVFGALLLMLRLTAADRRLSRNRQLALPVLMLLLLLLISACSWAGAAVPLLLPLFLVPLVLQVFYPQQVSATAWVGVLLLSAFALDWGLAWLCIQLVGGGVALLLNPQVQTWFQRMRALLLIVACQTAVWGAAALAERLPENLQTADVVMFLGLAALLSLGQSVVVRFFRV